MLLMKHMESNRVYGVKLSSFFFFKQKTAYEMRISDWSSDVCSSDLRALLPPWPVLVIEDVSGGSVEALLLGKVGAAPERLGAGGEEHEIGRASCRERVCQYV